MVDVDTFLTALYVMVDDFRHSSPPKIKQRRPGPEASLSSSEVITLAIFSQWGRFASERDFYRYASDQLREAFPTLPDRSQFNRLVRLHTDTIEAVALHLGQRVEDRQCPYQALDASAMPVRDSKRRGAGETDSINPLVMRAVPVAKIAVLNIVARFRVSGCVFG